MIETARKPAPWHFWLIAILSLVWNGFGGYDYTMTMTHNTAYLSQMGDPQQIIDWVEGFPLWAMIAYALGVWGSVAGSVLLVLRSRHAATAFLVSLVAAAVSFAAQAMTPLPPALDTTTAKVMPFAIMVIILALWWYARKQSENGLLR